MKRIRRIFSEGWRLLMWPSAHMCLVDYLARQDQKTIDE